MFLLFSNASAVNMQYLKYSPVASFEPEDFEMLQTVGRKALDENKDGVTSEWANTETGNSGSITPLDSSTIDEMHCRKTKLFNKAKDKSGQAVFTFCKVGDRWKALK
ncbi:hypothetical protein [sulfur-oxidizing endosymbiont of Gigantopelta aegis]|uniref:hypothetical protein n=1 Tax=sulfur-oxidizing endosymbiont of Gigantopelta aegis TaxID=2794934 RepID=UPI0018DD8817|nr:hypothetical protein [sulfur-oxidizing endosymbiont of Gigantopelta aegis]